ncbi:hypothetical protein [uncultured Subdoligranulum sp.]|uniref:hypothetical protein n=1 Tax=uncultured Subdoligranulum sp. TaxID=512298 RepID=UPI002632B890|nr:hypothetical protein [uncultured Subdoligranulum sp.]
MARFVWSIDPLAVTRLGQEPRDAPFTPGELARIGIPARKIPRVQAELARLAADGQLDRRALLALAPEIARQLL